MSLDNPTISNVADHFGVSTHTLRYYEKIRLLPPISKDRSGRRIYSNSDIERLHFIKRAQTMKFSLDEIRQLIDLDKHSLQEKPQVRKLVSEKLSDIEQSLTDLKLLKRDLTELLNACVASSQDEECPIIGGIKKLD